MDSILRKFPMEFPWTFPVDLFGNIQSNIDHQKSTFSRHFGLFQVVVFSTWNSTNQSEPASSLFFSFFFSFFFPFLSFFLYFCFLQLKNCERYYLVHGYEPLLQMTEHDGKERMRAPQYLKSYMQDQPLSSFGLAVSVLPSSQASVKRVFSSAKWQFEDRERLAQSKRTFISTRNRSAISSDGLRLCSVITKNMGSFSLPQNKPVDPGKKSSPQKHVFFSVFSYCLLLFIERVSAWTKPLCKQRRRWHPSKEPCGKVDLWAAHFKVKGQIKVEPERKRPGRHTQQFAGDPAKHTYTGAFGHFFSADFALFGNRAFSPEISETLLTGQPTEAQTHLFGLHATTRQIARPSGQILRGLSLFRDTMAEFLALAGNTALPKQCLPDCLKICKFLLPLTKNMQNCAKTSPFRL